MVGCEILNNLNVLMSKRGVLVATPEEIMSFNLKIKELTISEEDDYQSLQKCQNWINKNVCSIMDEADEILHPRNQLVYPTGVPALIDGKSVRWRVSMAVLESLFANIDNLYNEFGDNNIQFKKIGNNNINLHCPMIRLLTNDSYNKIIETVVNYIIGSKTNHSFLDFIPNWTQKEQENIINLVKSKKDIFDIFDCNELSKPCEILILTLRGLLFHGCLMTILQKRYNIDYGLPFTFGGIERKNKTEMAVPYRAKNIPSECSEFSHPDVAILYTLISYYYNGLTKIQMESIFNHSKIEVFYNAWMNEININQKKNNIKFDLVPMRWQHVNLSDEKQKLAIIKLLYTYMPVVNFYCDQMIFPNYAKQFEYKLSNSAWNLAKQPRNYLTNGFAGTNGLQTIYPISIKQNDLEIVKNTNKLLNKRLCFPLNNIIDHLPSKLTGLSFICFILELKIF